MNRPLLTGILALGLAATAQATVPGDSAPSTGYKEVDSITALRPLYSYDVLNDHSLIIWTDPFRPYLVELTFPVPAHDLQFSQAIGVTSTTGRIYARFDAIEVRGMRYSIKTIYELSRDQARRLTRPS